MALAKRNSQILQWKKPAGKATGTGWIYYGWINFATGDPPAGVLNGTDVVAGVVPTDATAGFPVIASFNGERGSIHRVEATGGLSTGTGPQVYRAMIYDLLWKAGAYAFNANQVLAGQPSYVSRIPNADYRGCTEIWIECTGGFTGTGDFTITYMNDQGVGGRVATASIGAGSLAGTVCHQLMLQAGDRGVQKIEQVQCATASAGSFNVLVLRPLVKHAQSLGTFTRSLDEAETQLVQVFDDSAIYVLTSGSATYNTTNPEIAIYIAVGDTVTPESDIDIDLETPAPASAAAGSGDTTPPVITPVSPTPGVAPGAPGGFPADLATARDTPIIFDVTDVDPGNRYIIVTARFRGGLVEEVVYRRGAFRGSYAAASSQSVIANGVRLSCRRLEGWPGSNNLDDVTFEVDAIDEAGNLAT